MKRWFYIVLLLILVAGGIYIYLHREELGLVRRSGVTAVEDETPESGAAAARPVTINWEQVDRTSDGFRVEMPNGYRQLQVPAYNERGGSDEVQMILSSPDGDTTFSVAWADDPPVVRVNGEEAERTLEMAREDTLTRTQSTLVSEARTTPLGLPGRDFVARNAGGGFLNARLIYSRPRLYMLVAAFPSAGARRDQDVERFFNSFNLVTSNRIPERMPSAPAMRN